MLPLRVLLFLLLLCKTIFAQQPKLLESQDLENFSSLEAPRKKLLEIALATGSEMKGLPYLFAGNGPKDGGFDCSGATYYILRNAGLEPPRTSSAQYLWVEKKSKLHKVPASATDTSDPAFANLKPGDLVFWSGTYIPVDDRTVDITHVAIYLGKEISDGRPVMINATNGRSYRGKKANGYGVYDFRVPSSKSSSKLVAFGTPPGLFPKD